MSTATLPERTTVSTTEVAPAQCPLCDSESQVLFDKHAVPIRECSSCRHRFALPPEAEGHVERVYADDYFFGGGAGYDDYLSEAELLRANGRRYAKRLARFMKPGRVLDVGAAAGFVLQGLCDGGWTGEGLEPNDAVARHGREKLGLKIHTGSLEEFETDEPFDLVSMIQVMGHFVDPREAAEQLASLVKPGGHCLIETWNVRSLTARAFGQSWHEYSPPSVLQWFSPETTASLFAGFSNAPRRDHRRELCYLRLRH